MTRPERTTIDLHGVTGKADLHARLQRGLGLPDFYGANWDAFWDAISSLTPMPRTLIWQGWDELAARWPGEAEQLQACLDDLADEYPELAPEVQHAPTPAPAPAPDTAAPPPPVSRKP